MKLTHSVVRYRRRTATAAVIVAALTLTAACGNSRSGEAASTSAGSGSAAASSGAASDGAASDGFTVDTSSCPAAATEKLADGENFKVGVSLPLSGPLAPVGAVVVAGLTTAVEKTNAAGGIDGHQVELLTLDNGLDPAREVSNIQQFIEQDGVFATINPVTTGIILAGQPINEANCVPQMSAVTTNLEMSDPTVHPWTTYSIPPADAEAAAIVEYLSKTDPGTTVIEMRQQNELGSDYEASFAARATDAGLTVLDPQLVSPGATAYDSQIANIVASDAKVLFLEFQAPACTAVLTALSAAGWKGVTVVPSSCSSAKYMASIAPAGNGVIAPFYTIDPGDPTNADDPGLKDYFADVAKYQPGADAKASNLLDGYGSMLLLAEEAKQAAAGPDGLTRASVMNVAWNLDVTRPQYLKPEQTTNGAADPYPVDYLELRKYNDATGGWGSTNVTYEYTKPQQ